MLARRIYARTLCTCKRRTYDSRVHACRALPFPDQRHICTCVPASASVTIKGVDVPLPLELDRGTVFMQRRSWKMTNTTHYQEI